MSNIFKFNDNFVKINYGIKYNRYIVKKCKLQFSLLKISTPDIYM